jgi:hypothetical protein
MSQPEFDPMTSQLRHGTLDNYANSICPLDILLPNLILNLLLQHKIGNNIKSHCKYLKGIKSYLKGY